ncbi:MAG: hypothetical protein AAF585_21220 [Verrucomicrobiota bacterium]
MKRVYLSFFFIIAILGSAAAGAEKEADTQSVEPDQMVVLLNGTFSYLMSGESRIEGISSHEVLPALLKRGWRIVSIQQSAGGDNRGRDSFGGYVLLERSTSVEAKAKN